MPSAQRVCFTPYQIQRETAFRDADVVNDYITEMFSRFHRGEIVYLRDQDHDVVCTGEYIRDHLSKALEGVTSTDTGFYPNSYKNLTAVSESAGRARVSHTTSRLYAIYSIAIDIDYRRDHRWREWDPLFFNELLIDREVYDQIPPPSWIEYGHQMRLIYVLESPICVCQRGGKTAMQTVQQIQRRICRIIQDAAESDRKICEPQRLSSFYRLPKSYNIKRGQRYRVQVMRWAPDRLTFQEMLDYLPNRPEWYDRWKQSKTTVSRKKKLYQIHNTYTLYQNRAALFDRLVDRPGIPRYILLWEWANNRAMIGEPTSLDDVLAFNQRLPDPLQEREIRSKMGWYLAHPKHYKRTNKTLRENLGLDEEEIMTTRERERLQKITEGKTRAQIAEKNYRTFLVYRRKGMKLTEIATAMGMSIRQIKTYNKRMKEGASC